MASSDTAFDVLTSLNLVGKPCTPETGEESFKIEEIVEAILKLACAMSEKWLYEYQQQFFRRVCEAILLHKGDMLTGLWSRQSGKTETIACIVASCMLILPELAKQFPNDWRLNITDDLGRYRGFKNGINFGIYAPILDQSQIMHERIRSMFETPGAVSVMYELGVKHSVNRGNIVVLTNGSSCLAMSASKNSKIEGHTHHVVVAEECQDIDAQKIRKSIHPMIASTKGMIVKIGTAGTQKGDFHASIRYNKRMEVLKGVKNHFFFPQQVCSKYNSMYRDYIEEEKLRIGEHSDEFRMAYNCEWLLERGMFIIDKYLMATGVAITEGKYAKLYNDGFRGTNLVVGIDLGKETDSTVLTIVDVDWSEPAIQETIVRNFKETEFIAYTKHVVAWKEFQGDDYEFQYQEILEWLSHFSPIRKIVLDATREASFADRVAHTAMLKDAEVEDFIFSLQTKAAGFRLWHGDLLARRFTFPADKATRTTPEYRRYVSQTLDLVKTYAGEYLVVGHPDEKGAHDDYPCSAMLANWGANKPTSDMMIEQISGNAFV